MIDAFVKAKPITDINYGCLYYHRLIIHDLEGLKNGLTKFMDKIFR